MLRINNLRVRLDDERTPRELAASRLRLPDSVIEEAVIVRRAVDARRKSNITFVYSLQVKAGRAESKALAKLRGDKDVIVVEDVQALPLTPGEQSLSARPVVIGLGPAGLLAAYTLARYGYRPLVLERGRDIEQRSRDVAAFWQKGIFEPTSNVQFGEGGAGTFSDGKLTTRVSDPDMREVLDVLVECGADPEIRYLHKPHIGTDKLRLVVKNIRQRIIEMGGEVQFAAQVTDVEIKDGALTALIVNGQRRIACTTALLGIGHSARDTYEMLYQRGVLMQPKAFAIGVRIEHPQSLIDRAQYGEAAGHPKLGAADYALVYHDKAAGRTAYSFCMCPGGLVVAAASEAGGVVTNGMSFHNRASGTANSALVVNVTPADYGEGVLDGVAFQRRYEALAFAAGGSTYKAPAQTVGDFLAKTSGRQSVTAASYRPGVVAADLRSCLPAFVTDTLAQALPDFDRKIKGFAQADVIMTGVETRTSAPLRIVRNETYMAVGTAGLYPMGEGAGYAGGIMSAALDGFHAAAAIVRQYKPSI